ncbi:MAG: hypothetical protein M1426_01830 [Patescibacteria group bacterium]|nr:hypothetical protein [Patescibacteria group bacterium]
MKLDTLKFALASGILIAIMYAWVTLAALINVPGFTPFASLIEQGYKFYGYSISGAGIFVGAIYGFIEGFVWFGALAWLYNKLLNK